MFDYPCVTLSLHEFNNPSSANESHTLLKQMEKNLKKNPLVNITISNTSSPCPKGYEKLRVGKFSGIRSGCICKNDNRVHLRPYCWAYPNNCKYVHGADEEDEFIWREKNICGKRLKGWKFIKEGDSCANHNLRECSSGFCISGKVCPISSMIMKKTPINHTFTSNQFAYGSHYLQISRNTQLLPIVDLDSTISNLPCLEPLEKKTKNSFRNILSS